ncbi:MAG: HAMP domain-containing histidine kinase [Thaumarchaeota archaeon]|nr:HAMP domain-containing histidine kinase [Nitrososphaerota archaeon]
MTDPECTRYFSMIKKATTRISHQVNEVLGYVTPQDLEIKPHSIYDIIQTTVERITVPSSVKLSIPVSNVMVDCDSEQLEIVFANLILNAVQAMEDMGKIDITIQDRNDYVIIDIKDNGPGIPPDVLPEIFEPLFTTRQIGTGLGLPSCKNMVEKHGGAITVDTEIGSGTTFSIKLPKTAK